MSSPSAGIRVNWLILVGGLVTFLGVLGLLAIGFNFNPRRLDTGVLVGKKAPTFVLQSMDGQPVSMADLKGRPVVLNFWSTWCIPCKQEHPLLQRYPLVYPDVTFLGVVYQDKQPIVERFLKSAPIPYETMMDPEGKVAIAFGVTGVPETYFIDKNGIVQHKTAGPLSEPELVGQLELLSQ